jgi:predicted dehydrogenase
MSKIDKQFGIGIVGFGLIGQKLAKAIGAGGRLVACADIDVRHAESLVKDSGTQIFCDWRDLVRLPEVDLATIANPPISNKNSIF